MLQVGTARGGYCIQGGVGEGAGTQTDRQHIGTACGSKGRQGKTGIRDTFLRGLWAVTWRCFSPRWCSTNAIWKYYLSRFPWGFFVHPKMGFSQCIYWVFTIGISLRGPIRGTGSDGKLNLLLLLLAKDVFINTSKLREFRSSGTKVSPLAALLICH